MKRIQFEISAFKNRGQWVFNDSKHDLYHERFVNGADKLLDELTSNGTRCKIVFSNFQGRNTKYVLEKLSPENNGLHGTYYEFRPLDFTVWLCSSLLCYFSYPPQHIYFSLERK